MRATYYTPVKRNHIVGPAGVGSILISRSGVTVLMAGLPTWVNAAPEGTGDPAAQRQHRATIIDNQTLHDTQLESQLGVARLIAPPTVGDDPRYGVTWFIPAARFPLAQYCTNPRCQRLGDGSPEDPSIGRCGVCSPDRKRRPPLQQVPVLLVCQEGHLDEVDWLALVHPDGLCASPQLTYRAASEITTPEVRCACGQVARLARDHSTPCRGRRPWLPGSENERCKRVMQVLDRTSTGVYYPDVRSALHIPAPGGLRDSVLRWLQEDRAASMLLGIQAPEALRPLHDRARVIFPDLTTADLTRHVEHLRSGSGIGENAGRVGELDALTSGRRGQHTSDGPPVLDAEVVDPASFDQLLVGPAGPISGVVAVHRLAETRAIAGFTRVKPPAHDRDVGRGIELMWGTARRVPQQSDWLPGHRVFGEGFLLTLNADRVARWVSRSAASFDVQNHRGRALDAPFQLAHTLAHMLINAAGTTCGYPVASLRDRIYAEDDRLALLIYTAAGDSLGTLGGLVELARPGALEPLLEEALSRARWCGLDPVCLNPLNHVTDDRAGACHQCCLLPETSCEWFNLALDRATLVGRGTTIGYLDLS